MSEFITHTAVFEDCGRLALISPGVCEPFRFVLKKYWDLARLATLTRSGDKYTIQLLQYCREHWANRRDGDFVEEKLAYVLGWRYHNATDRHFKPIYRQVEPEHYKNEDPKHDPDEGNVSNVRMYHDIIVYREVYDCGRRGGMSPHLLEDNLTGHPASASVAVAPVEAAVGAVIQRTLLGLQPFTTKESNLDKWLPMFLHQRQDYYVDLHSFARGLEAPDPDFLRRFILENNFYDRRDPLIRLARALQQDADHSDISLDQALEQAQHQSQYAQTLREGCQFLTACSEFFERKIDERELSVRLHLATPHYNALTGGNQ